MPECVLNGAVRLSQKAYTSLLPLKDEDGTAFLEVFDYDTLYDERDQSLFVHTEWKKHWNQTWWMKEISKVKDIDTVDKITQIGDTTDETVVYLITTDAVVTLDPWMYINDIVKSFNRESLLFKSILKDKAVLSRLSGESSTVMETDDFVDMLYRFDHFKRT